jgi:hypothetical protein
MAVAVFEKGQRVFVRPMGCWARVERIVPHWVKGVEAPMRVQYDLGMGREFTAAELFAPDALPKVRGDETVWRLARVQGAGLTARDGETRTLPAVFTDEGDWGGWRIEPSDYERDPARGEHQARLIAAAPRLFEAARALVAFADAGDGDVPADLAPALGEARSALRAVFGVAEPESALAAE